MSAIHRIRFRSLPVSWADLVDAAAEAGELYDADELERYARDNPPSAAAVATVATAYRAARQAAAYAPLGYQPAVSSDPRYIGAKLRFQTHQLMRRYQVGLR
jgi:hypothetical protein